MLHIWQKPRSGTALSVVQVTGASGQLWRLERAETDDFQLHGVTVDGAVEISWDEATTEVSLIYAYAPQHVLMQGIRLIWTIDANRLKPSRYKLHLQPPFGWMNDPNGLCQINGTTHVFYQHYPHGRRWNTMHWGHAASQNLVDWVHLPVFLQPRAEILAQKSKVGGAFSGSAVPMPDGSLRVFYTDREDDRLPNWEWQATALSQDLISASPSTVLVKDRPPLAGFGKDMRDSYVFRGPDGLWKMLLGGADEQGGVILLYESAAADAASGWSFAGVLYREPLPAGIPLECPCLLRLADDGEQARHVLIFGMLGTRDEETRRRNLSYAVIGHFDGKSFTATARQEVDFGTDAYAFQGFQHESGPLGIAWAANWTDVFKDRDFASAMTFPRRLLWKNGALHTPPVDGVDQLRLHSLASGADVLSGPVQIHGGLAEVALEFAGSNQRFRVDFTHPTFKLALHYDGSTLELLYEPPGMRVVPRYLARDVSLNNLRIFIDVGLIEIYAQDGRWCATKRFDSDLPVSAVCVSSESELAKADIWQLRPCKGFPV